MKYALILTLCWMTWGHAQTVLKSFRAENQKPHYSSKPLNYPIVLHVSVEKEPSNDSYRLAIEAFFKENNNTHFFFHNALPQLYQLLHYADELILHPEYTVSDTAYLKSSPLMFTTFSFKNHFLAPNRIHSWVAKALVFPDTIRIDLHRIKKFRVHEYYGFIDFKNLVESQNLDQAFPRTKTHLRLFADNKLSHKRVRLDFFDHNDRSFNCEIDRVPRYVSRGQSEYGQTYLLNGPCQGSDELTWIELISNDSEVPDHDPQTKITVLHLYPAAISLEIDRSQLPQN